MLRVILDLHTGATSPSLSLSLHLTDGPGLYTFKFSVSPKAWPPRRGCLSVCTVCCAGARIAKV